MATRVLPRRLALHSVALVAITVAANGCGVTALPTGGPTTSPVASAAMGPPAIGIDWAKAASVEGPANYEESVPPTYSGTHPILRIAGQATMSDVTSLPGAGYVAVGYVPPDWQPVAWTSPDGSTWSIHTMGRTDFTFPVALAGGVGGTVVAVGRSRAAPAAWTTVDGVAWQQHVVPTLSDGDVPERLTSIAAGDHGYVAGGSAGPELFDRHARFWTSADGVEWKPVPDDPSAFANAEVRAIARFGDGFVAVGVVGTVQEPTGAVAWTSPDGETWARVDDPSFENGVAVAVVEAPPGGLVAVGSDVDRREAVAWTSADGRRWAKSPSEASREHSGGYAWMTDALSVDGLVIAIGEDQGLQRGTATSWVSRDGDTWVQAKTAPVQEQGEFYAIAQGGPGAIAVGSFGAPDSYVPIVWLTPGR